MKQEILVNKRIVIMNKKIIIISLIIISLLIIATFLIQKTIHGIIIKDFEKGFEKVFANNIENTNISYDNIKIKGLFKPKKIFITNLNIDKKNFGITSKKITFTVKTKEHYLTSLHDTTIYIKSSQQKNKTTSNDQIIIKEKILTNIKNNQGKEEVTVKLPQKILIKTLYDNAMVIYNQETPILTYNLENNKLINLSYRDNGSITYNRNNEIIASYKEAIFNIDKNDNHALWKINFTINEQKFVNTKSADKENSQKTLNILLDATYQDSTKEKNLFTKILILTILV